MPITLEFFPAGNGDAILLSFDGQYMLVDCGYPSTYRRHLKPRLQEIAAAGGRLSKLIITHIDADHISGAVTFLEDNGPADKPTVIPVDEVWHNSYRHLQFEEKDEGDFGGHSPELRLPGTRQEDDADTSGGDVSYRQGSTLAAVLLAGDYRWNSDFEGLAVMTDQPLRLELGPKTALTLLGPTYDDLDRLAKKWLKDLRKRYGERLNADAFFDDAFERLMEMEPKPRMQRGRPVSAGPDFVRQNLTEWRRERDEDHSVTNASSIVFLLEHAGKKLLFPGDAVPSRLLEQVRRCFPEAAFPLVLDLLKVPHHGGFSNNSPELLAALPARHYVFSSNGKRYHHPHPETIAWILHQHADTPKQLIFNYTQDRLRPLSHPVLQERYQFGISLPETEGFARLVLA